MIEKIQEAISAGIRKSADDLTVDVRSSARTTGWSRGEAAELRVVPTAGGLSLTAGEQASSAEYGSAGVPPRPAVRRWVNKERDIEARIVKSLESSLQGVL